MGIGSKSVVLVTAGLTVVCILAVADNFGFNPPRNVGQATLRAVDEPSTAREISPRRPQLSNHHETIAMTPLTDRLYELFPSDQKDDRHGSVQSVLSDPLSFHCLPKDVRLNDVVTYGGSQKGNVTVEK